MECKSRPIPAFRVLRWQMQALILKTHFSRGVRVAVMVRRCADAPYGPSPLHIDSVRGFRAFHIFRDGVFGVPHRGTFQIRRRWYRIGACLPLHRH